MESKFRKFTTFSTFQVIPEHIVQNNNDSVTVETFQRDVSMFYNILLIFFCINQSLCHDDEQISALCDYINLFLNERYIRDRSLRAMS